MGDKLKLFENRKIRAIWDEKKEEWYFSVIDVIAILTDSPDPKRYWSALYSFGFFVKDQVTISV